jgi:hypothetical protein
MVLNFFSIHKKKPRLAHRILNEWKPKAIGFVQDEEQILLLRFDSVSSSVSSLVSI